MALPLAVSYTTYATSLKEQTGDIIMFTQFEEGNLLSETCDDVESCDRSDDNSIIPPLINEEEIDAMDSGDGFEDEPISKQMLEDILDSNKSNPSVKRREALQYT